MNRKIAVVEDEKDIRDSLKLILSREDYGVTVYADGTEALIGFKENVPALALLDWMLPGLSGIDLLKILRNDSRFKKCGIIMLTAKSSELNIVDALNLGADDYVVKPYKKEELIARIKAVLRRYVSSDDKKEELLRLNNIWVNRASYQAGDADSRFDLTPMEFRMLSMFVSSPGRLFTRSQIMHQFWQDSDSVDERAVDIHIARLRDKMGKNGKLIETIRGLGYRVRESS
jgi:two-component system, OmpR family, phosphate regulon response regulator PhoB